MSLVSLVRDQPPVHREVPGIRASERERERETGRERKGEVSPSYLLTVQRHKKLKNKKT
jgi:hypothetical protein